MEKLIKTEKEYRGALKEAERLIDLDPKSDTADGDRLELLTFLISKYEDEHYSIDLPSPIEAIQFRMGQQNLARNDLIPYIGNRHKVSDVLIGKRPLTLKMIRALNAGLGIPAEVLLQETGAKIPEQFLGIDWDKFPIKDMFVRNWFEGFTGTATDAKDKAEELMRKFLENVEPYNFLETSYRKKVRKGAVMDDYALLAWEVKVLKIAQNLQLPIKYCKGSVSCDFLRDLAKVSCLENGPKLAVEFLNKHGIHVVILRHLLKTHLDGALLSLNKKTPVIGLTLRHNRLDNFWFTLFHELVHMKLHFDSSKFNKFFDDLDAQGDEKEEATNKIACDSLVPPNEFNMILNDHSPQNVLDLSRKINVHPSIIAGRVRKEKNNFRLLSRFIAPFSVRRFFVDELKV